MRRHFEGAKLKQPQPAVRPGWGVEFVDAKFGSVGVAGQVNQEIAQQPVDQPRRFAFHAGSRLFRHLLKGDFQFVKVIVARFVDPRRLTGGTDKHACEKIRQRGMVLPVADEALQQIRSAQQRAITHIRAA